MSHKLTFAEPANERVFRCCQHYVSRVILLGSLHRSEGGLELY